MRSRILVRQYGPLVALSLATFLAIGVIAEIGLRLYQGRLLSTRHLILDRGREWRSALYDHDPKLGWVPRQGASLTGKDLPWKQNRSRAPGTRARARVTIREHGIRSNGFQGPFKGRPLVLAVGDSFTFGAQVSDDQTWPAALERRLGVRVLNGGVPAYGLDQSILRAEDLTRVYAPDLVLISFIGADLKRAAASSRGRAAKPFFRAKQGELSLHNIPVPSPEEGVDPFRKLFGYSYVVDRVMSILKPHYWKEGSSKATGEDPIEIGCLLMKRIAQLQRQQPLEVVVVAQSSRRAEHPELVTPVLECAYLEGLSAFDFLPVMKTEKARDRKRYESYYMGHMSPSGNEFTARILAERIPVVAEFSRLSGRVRLESLLR